ncbi:MAG TPA: FMN-binding protein, partial [Mycobacteriales bacterium]|nr:FMN-binding protein [Mycobacteriales bacterium]
MRRALFAVSGTIAGLVMLLSFKTQATPAVTPPAASTPDTGGTGTGDTGGTAADPTTPSASASASGRSGGDGTYTGDSADTRWGPVQVRITVSGGAVTAVAAVDYPQDNGRDLEINSYAIPQLDQEATAAGSASIDTVSGATVTSDGYIQSLQSAL